MGKGGPSGPPFRLQRSQRAATVGRGNQPEVPLPRSCQLISIPGLLLGLLAVVFPGHDAFAAPRAVPPVEVSRGASLETPMPFVSPSGNQILTYVAQAGGQDLLFTERGSEGGEFEPPVTLSTSGSFQDPSLSFTGEGIYANWGIAISNAVAEQTFRPEGGTFAAKQPLTGCHRFVDSASGPGNQIAVACQHIRPTNPPETTAFGSSPVLGPVAVSEELVPAAYDPFVRAELETGEDGTIAIVSWGRKTTTVPPPANQTMRVRVSIKSPATSYSADVAEATWPNEVAAGPPVVLSDGTVAVPLGGSAGARVMIRPPGALTSFTPHPLTGEGIWGMGRDSNQNLHVASGNVNQREYWSQTRAPGGVFATSSPIPRPTNPGAGDSYLTGFQVAPDGTEYALFRGDDGTYVASRAPDESFAAPIKLGDQSRENPESALTPEGDLVVSWTHEHGPSDRSLRFGGLDKTEPEVTVNAFPGRAADGTRVDFSASATDAFGIASTEWKFGSRRVSGSEASHTFRIPGRYPVSFTAVDVAGHRTEVKRSVLVPFSPNSKPVIKVRGPKKLRFRALKKRGLKLVVTSRPPIRLKVVLGTSKRKARKRPLAVKVVRSTRGRHLLRVKPRPARLGKRRKLRLFVLVTGTTAAGKETTVVRTIRIRR